MKARYPHVLWATRALADHITRHGNNTNNINNTTTVKNAGNTGMENPIL